MGCFKALTIQPALSAMPLDQAIYAAARDRIYGVRGGYIYEFNATTGALIQSFRYQAPAFGDASICYDPVNDKLFCSVWRDMAFANGGDTNYDIIVSKKLYRINPTTPMTVDVSAEINGEPLFPGYIGTSQQHLGPHRIIYNAGVIYCATYGNTNSNLCSINVATLAVITNGESPSWNNGYWLDFCIQPAGAEPLQIWLVDPTAKVQPCADPALTYASSAYFEYDATDYAAPYNIIYGVCWCAATGRMYGTCRKPTVLRWTPDLAGSPFTDIAALNTGDANATPYRIAYNPYDGLIYVPGYKSNNVVVIQPGAGATLDTIVATRTGFDSPFDVVFTPTKKWAVQQGDVPLKEIV